MPTARSCDPTLVIFHCTPSPLPTPSHILRCLQLGLRTCDWTQRLKPLPTTRTRQSPHKAVMGMPRGLRTCDWTQRLKPLPTTRTRQSPHKPIMGTPRCITWDFALVIGRSVSSHCRQRARGSRGLTCETIELDQCSAGRCCEPRKAKRHTSETSKVSCCPPLNPLLTAADF